MTSFENIREVELKEYQSVFLEKDRMSSECGLLIHKDYKNKLTVEFPSPLNQERWKITPSSWVGYIRVSDHIAFRIEPKVALLNIFRMFEYAYNLGEIEFQEELYQCRSMIDFYNHLAVAFAKRVNERITKGLYGNYVSYNEILPYVRGRVDIKRVINQPWKVQPNCHYQQHTRDVEDNRILAWALHVIRRNVQSKPKTKTISKKALMGLLGVVSLKSYPVKATINRLYNRLNSDYRNLHLLCKFFLETSGPNLIKGNDKMLSFTIDMNALYEKFVARWLKKHIDFGFVEFQEKCSISDDNQLNIYIDIVLYDRENKPMAVLDTKYKKEIQTSDIFQITTYAVRKNCKHAFLIYPEVTNQSIYIHDTKNVKILRFPLEGDLEENGMRFLDTLRKELSV